MPPAGRNSSTEFLIQEASINSGTPGDTDISFSNQDVDIYRTFNSLNAAEAGASGANYLNSTDLLSGNYQLNLAAYADGVDTVVTDTSNGVRFDSGWTTGSQNYIKVYTIFNIVTRI